MTTDADAHADDDARVLDGNAIAGLLAEIFDGAELTATRRGCATCGQAHAIGRHRLYRGAGLVLRCPGCDDVALVVVERDDDRRQVALTGHWAFTTGRR